MYELIILRYCILMYLVVIANWLSAQTFFYASKRWSGSNPICAKDQAMCSGIT